MLELRHKNVDRERRCERLRPARIHGDQERAPYLFAHCRICPAGYTGGQRAVLEKMVPAAMPVNMKQKCRPAKHINAFRFYVRN